LLFCCPIMMGLWLYQIVTALVTLILLKTPNRLSRKIIVPKVVTIW
jgi:hypothetical protein